MLHDLLQSLTAWDQMVFHKINEQWSSTFLNFLMPFLREKLLWIPLYLILIYSWVKKYEWKGVYLLLALIGSVVLSDFLSAHVIKIIFHRLRPCHDIASISHFIARIDCGSGFSFVSSHAANHFTIAAFVSIWFRKNKPILEPLAYLWALSIAYAQVYVGVHYPLDVLGGALLGLILGWTIGYMSLKWTGMGRLSPQTV